MASQFYYPIVSKIPSKKQVQGSSSLIKYSISFSLTLLFKIDSFSLIMVELSFLKKLESFEYTSDKPKLKDVLL
jgi:hypothetical protein